MGEVDPSSDGLYVISWWHVLTESDTSKESRQYTFYDISKT